MFVADPGNPGKNIVTFGEDAAGASDLLTLRLTGGNQLEYQLNGGGFTNDLNSSSAGIQALFLNQISRIDVALGAGGDVLTLDTSNGPVFPSPAGIVFQGGNGIDGIVAAQDTDMFLSDGSLTLSSGGTVSLSSVERATLTGGNGPNTIDATGFSGKATLDGGNQNDHLIGGSGNDLLLGLQGSDTMEGGGGDDTLQGGNSDCSFFGGDGNDLLITGNGQDTLRGGDGDDTLLSGNGMDLLDGGAGDDLLESGNGNDQLFGGPGVDMVRAAVNGGVTLTDSSLAGQGHDTLDSIEQASLLSGSGNDIIDAAAFTGQTTLDGGGGNDVLIGGQGENTFVRLPGQTGDIIMYGGPGIDQYDLAPSDVITIVEQSGTDSISFATAGSAITLDLTLSSGTPQTVDSSGSTVALTGQLENLFGSVYGDAFTGNDASNIIFGGLGTDTVTAGDGSDIVYGGTAGGTGDSDTSSDIIFGGLGGDTVDGGGGNDIIFGGTAGGTSDSDTSNDIIFGGLGSDTVDGGGGSDIIFGGTASGTGDGDTSGDIIYGGLGADTVHSGSGNDIVFGGTAGGTSDNDTSNDIIFGGLGSDTVDSGGGSDIVYGGTTGGGTDSDSGSDIIYGGLGSDQIDAGGGADIVFGGTAGGSGDSDTGGDIIYGGIGSDQVDAGGGSDIVFGSTGNPGADPSGNDTLDGGAGDDLLVGGAGDDLLQGGPGNDSYRFDGNNLGSDVVVESANLDTDSLDFSAFAAAAAVDLSLTSSQTVSSGNLNLTFSSSTGIEDVTGSPFADSVSGNLRNNRLTGADPLDDRYLNPPGWNGRTQVVFLDFDSDTGIDWQGQPKSEHVYTVPERNDIQARMAADYALFRYVITQTLPLSGTYATIFFNKTPVLNGQPIIGAAGLADELDLGNDNLAGTVAVDANDFLGGNNLPPASSANFVAFSSTVAAHELGHLVGLVHIDSAGPIGMGTPLALAASAMLPAYPGPQDAFETNLHLMASPDSVGSSLLDAVADPFFGEREAVKLAFNESGVTIAEQAAAHSTIATAQAITLTSLAVPNTLVEGLQRGKDFAVAAARVVGAINLDLGGTSENDFYSFTGRAGDLLSIQVYSGVLTRITNPIDSILRVYDTAGNLVPYHGSVAVNDDERAGLNRDSILIDLVLPAAGTYSIEIDTFSSTEVPDTDTGAYELFIYRFDAGNASDGGDFLDGRDGNDSVYGGMGNDILLGGVGGDNLGGGLGFDILIGGLGADALLGEDGGDILIGGTTNYDLNRAALDAIMAVWSSANSYANKVKIIRTGVDPAKTIKLTPTTVHDDGLANVLTGGPDFDWFFTGKKDIVTDLVTGETTTKI